MLKGVDPLLGPDLLAILRAMGHGDEIVLADSNFPAAANARRLVRLDGVDGVRVARAIVSVMPLDEAVPNAAFRMAVTGKPDEIPPIIADYGRVLAEQGYERGIEGIERMAFYERAREAFAIVATGETRLWANLLLKKGVVAP